MTKLKLSAALIAAAMLATPAMAHAGIVTSQYPAEGGYASGSPTARHIDGHVVFSVPRAGASAPDNCDVGDDPHICTDSGTSPAS